MILSKGNSPPADPGRAVESAKGAGQAKAERFPGERRPRGGATFLPENCLEERPACPLCGGTGYRDGGVCRCLRSCYAREQQKELSRMLDLGGQSFDTFSLEWYSDRTEPGQKRSARSHMEERVYNSCAEFAHRFGRRFENLLFFGAPGLGKTHLSAAVAREVSGAGWSVVYDTAGRVFRAFEDWKFSREEAGEDVERVLRCDLLILDDLGTELTTAFVQSALYEIVNTRLIERRPTILSTNLMPAVSTIFPKIDTLITNLNAITSDPALTASVKRLDNITLELQATMKSLNDVMTQLRPVASNVTSITANVDTITGDLAAVSGMLRNAPVDTLMASLQASLANLEVLTNDLNNPDGTLGKLSKDPALYENLNATVASLDSLFIDIKRNPKRYVTIKVF